MSEHLLERMPTDEEYDLLMRTIEPKLIEQERVKILHRINLFCLGMDSDKEREYIDYRIRRFLVSEGLRQGIVC